jgi:murein DD-endopeptidase MepM/ murein hydrolase activator NlpD
VTLAAVKAAPDASADAAPSETIVRVRRGDTLFQLLRNAGVSPAEASEAIGALTTVFDPRDIRPGHEITLTFAPTEGDVAQARPDAPLLLAAAIDTDLTRRLTMSRDDDGRFNAIIRDVPLSSELIYATGKVTSSLYEAAVTAGVPPAVLVAMIRGFSYDVDFQREIQAGDSFEVAYERQIDDHGRAVVTGDALQFAALVLGGERRAIYRYAPGEGEDDLFDDRGDSVRKALLRTPIDGARLTSAFGSRRHPILGYTLMHRGVDFGAATGSPIEAAGDGVVEVAGRNGGYGNYVRIRHNAEFATAYGHMSRFGAGIRTGMKVKQGQTIGYVGATGRATGPHLHYEVLRRGSQVNPLGLRFAAGRKLDGTELNLFYTAKIALEQKVAALATLATLAAAGQ